ncbi:hypothetical protein MLD38_028622 [Melastoma candidum]|uniref:Uncharacterized protein n=1 Tax=Melastoma candidum TaxID=119954 RepID=A0ACB9N3S8_9MYRT|nr:hypothetical protein MLD38_028622 [Melastoma candidum]
MATACSTILRSIPTRSEVRIPPPAVREARPFPTRRQALFLTSSALLLRPNPSLAEDIPLFGLRKKLKKVEEEAEVIVKEGFEAAEKGVEAVEKGVEAVEEGVVTVERGVVAVEKGVEEAVSFGGYAQAGAVAAAEVFGVVVATAIVNGILGPEGQRS